jgi:hypothetical protein
MTRPRLIRGLRIAWSVWWGILCVLLIGLWVRSYWRVDVVSATIKSERIIGHSVKGRLRVSVAEGSDLTDRPPWEVVSFPPQAGPSDESFWAFTIQTTTTDTYASFPLWLLTLICAVLASLPWIAWKYSLRTLLIATTLIAVVLGLAVWSSS